MPVGGIKSFSVFGKRKGGKDPGTRTLNSAEYRERQVWVNLEEAAV
jgi:hypothetical protein